MRFRWIKYYYLPIYSAMLLGSASLDAGVSSIRPSPSQNQGTAMHASPPVSPGSNTSSDQGNPKPETTPAPQTHALSDSLAPYLLGASIPATSLVGYLIYKTHKAKPSKQQVLENLDLDLPLDERGKKPKNIYVPKSIYISPPKNQYAE